MHRLKTYLMVFVLLALTGYTKAQQNVALNKPVQVSSANVAYPAGNITDGKISRNSKWQASTTKAPHIVEIDLQRYCTLSEVVVHSGILDAEKKPEEMTQSAGFWSLKNFKLQYWDDANWSDFPKAEVHENRLVAVNFKFSPAITTYKIRLMCDDGEAVNIMEIEAFGTITPNMPLPPTVTPTLKKAITVNGPLKTTVKVSNQTVGKTMKFVGYNQGYYFPGSNVSGWLEYSNVNSLRVWASLNAFVPERSVQAKATVNDVDEFDKLKTELRENPENNRFIKWNELLPLYNKPDSSSTNAMVYNYALSELKRLGIAVVLQLGSTDFNDTWQNKWKQWQRYYAIAFYSAKTGNVAMYAMQNEPNHRNSGPMKLDQWITGSKIVSDAIHCAVSDVNKLYSKKLQPKFVGPVTAGNNTEWWSAIAKSNNTDYHGKTVATEQVDLFSTHSYNSPAVGYQTRIANINKVWADNHPQGKTLPVMYTEIGRWMNAYLIDKEETMDSPSLFTEWAGIYANNMKNGGYGMWAFKFANTASNTYPRGIKSGHHFIWQGKRIVEDAYTNIALHKKVTASSASNKAFLVTDGNKADSSAWISGSEKEKWLQIDFGNEVEIGSAVIYTGSAGGVYTAPDRARNFKLQYQNGDTWTTIAATEEKNNKYAQVFMQFKQAVKTRKIRFISTDTELKVREIKLFAKGDGPSQQPDYNISGIQRTGEVVRLFATGFKDERPLLKTETTVTDTDLDTYTALDPLTGNYYMWLVNRNTSNYQLTINLASLKLATGTAITAQTVDQTHYGEVTQLFKLPVDGKFNYTLNSQSVVLLTISPTVAAVQNIPCGTFATVQGGAKANQVIPSGTLNIQLDAGNPNNNKVVYLGFNTVAVQPKNVKKAVFAVSGRVDKDSRPYRLHVYAIPQKKLLQRSGLTWNNAPFLDNKEALIKNVGTDVFVAGEIAFTRTGQYHYLDVTDILKKHHDSNITFVLVRETRQLGDDEDKGRRVSLALPTVKEKPMLMIW